MKTKQASKRKRGRQLRSTGIVLRQPATAYRDAEGWVLMDSKGEPTDWPADWPKEINRRFLKSKGVMPSP